MRRDWLAGVLGCLLMLVADAGWAAKASQPPKLTREGLVNLSLALNYLDAGNLQGSLIRAQKALHTDPKSADVHLAIGMIHDRMGNQDLASAAFARALKLDPEDGNVHNTYGAWLCQHQTAAEAEPHFQKALLNPGKSSTRNILLNAGRCAYKAGELDKSEQHLRAALEKSPAHAATLLLLAEVKHAQGQDFEARAFLQRREALGPLDARTYELAAEIETGAGDPKAAERYRTLLREKFPDHQEPTGEGAGRP